MIPAVDAALRRLITEEALADEGVEIAFEAPTREWSARRNSPTVNLYLYDLREDVGRRQRGLLNLYDEDRVVVGRRMPPRYFNLSYLVTAWTQRAEDEHQLLADVLMCLLEFTTLPGVAGVPLPHDVTVALPPPKDRSFADVWSALGGELKPSLDVVVGVPFDRAPTYRAGPPVREGMSLSFGDIVDGGRDTGLRGPEPAAGEAGEGAGSEPDTDSPHQQGRPVAMRRRVRGTRSGGGRR